MVDGSTQMKFAVQVFVPLMTGLPERSTVMAENGVVSCRNSGTWKVPWTSRTPLIVVDEVTVKAGA